MSIPGEEDIQWRDLPAVWKVGAVDEWNRRTQFGKVLYPVWFVMSAMLWIVGFAFLALITFPAWVNKGLDWVAGQVSRALPDVYKEGSMKETQ